MGVHVHSEQRDAGRRRLGYTGGHAPARPTDATCTAHAARATATAAIATAAATLSAAAFATASTTFA